MSKKEVDINILISVDNNKKTSITATPNSFQKLNTKLSVPQLAYLLKIMYELKLITNKNQTDLLKFISRNFQTPNSKEISLSSLRSKYCNIDDATRKAVYRIIIDMMNYVNKK